MLTSLVLFTILLSSSSFEQKLNIDLTLSKEESDNFKKLVDITEMQHNATVSFHKKQLDILNKLNDIESKQSENLKVLPEIVKMLSEQQSKKASTVDNQQINDSTPKHGEVTTKTGTETTIKDPKITVKL